MYQHLGRQTHCVFEEGCPPGGDEALRMVHAYNGFRPHTFMRRWCREIRARAKSSIVEAALGVESLFEIYRYLH
jgi:hypothetical protein